MRKEYDQICEADAQTMINKVKQGDLSFGADELDKEPARSSVTRLQAPTARAQLGPVQPAFPAHVGLASPLSSGNTQNIVLPPPPGPEPRPGWLSKMAHFGGQ